MGLNVAKWQSGKVAGWGAERARSNLRGPKITASSLVYYGSSKLDDFDEFFIKIGPIGGPKFGGARKMLYLCTRKQEVASTSEGCGSA
jgi:hypothetical protein